MRSVERRCAYSSAGKFRGESSRAMYQASHYIDAVQSNFSSRTFFKTEMLQKVAIVSDLHCHPKGHQHWDSLLHYDAPRTPTSKHPVASLLRLIEEEGFTADARLVPGDLTNQMCMPGLKPGWAFCNEIANGLHAELVAATV